MKDNWLWDRKISEAEAKGSLKKPGTTQIKQAGTDERHDLIEAVRELFQLKGNQ